MTLQTDPDIRTIDIQKPFLVLSKRSLLVSIDELDKMKSALWILLYLIVGGGTFWFANIALLHSWGDSGPNFGILTVLLPLVTISSYGILYCVGGRRPDGPSIAVFMLIGIIILGPPSLKLFWSFSLVDWGSVGMLALNPMNIFVTFGYSGSIGALFILLPALIALHLLYEKNHWVIPTRDSGSPPPPP